MTRVRVTLWLAAVVAGLMLSGVALFSFPRQVAVPVAARSFCDGPAQVRHDDAGNAWDRNFGRVRCVDAFQRPTGDVTALVVAVVTSAALALVVAVMLLVATIDRQHRHLRYQARMRARAHLG